MKILKSAVIFTALILSSCNEKDPTGANFNSDTKNELLQMPYFHTDLSNCARCGTESPDDLKVAVIVEPRSLSLVISVIKSALRALPNDWIIQVFHGLNNENFLRDHFNDEIETGRMVLSKMNVRNIDLPYYNNKIMLNPYFWKSVIGETILTFEADSTFCNNGTKIDDFLDYDIIGAPWGDHLQWFRDDGICYAYDSDNRKGVRILSTSPDVTLQSLKDQGFHNIRTYKPVVGNSGFMLRKRSKILEVLGRYVTTSAAYINYGSDTFYACAFLDQTDDGIDVKIPDFDTALRFSVETLFYERPFGVHKPWLYLKRSELERLGQQCPGLNEHLKPYYETKHGWGK